MTVLHGHLEVVRYEPEPSEAGWWAVRNEPMLRPVFVWVEDPADDEAAVGGHETT